MYFKDFFYLYPEKRDKGDVNKTLIQWFSLRIRDTHFTVASGSDINVLMNTLHKYVRKYKTGDRLIEALNSLSCGSTVCESEFIRRSKQFAERKHEQFDDLLDEVIDKALAENREDSPIRKAKNRVTVVAKEPPEPVEKVQEAETPKKPLIIKARKLKRI